jgi:hypothetical protein
MERFEENKEFLNSLIYGPKGLRIRTIKSATTEELQSLVEVCINIRSFPTSRKENKELKPTFNYLRTILKRKTYDVDRVKDYFIKNLEYLSLWIKFVLAKVVELSICGLLNNG